MGGRGQNIFAVRVREIEGKTCTIGALRVHSVKSYIVLSTCTTFLFVLAVSDYILHDHAPTMMGPVTHHSGSRVSMQCEKVTRAQSFLVIQGGGGSDPYDWFYLYLCPPPSASGDCHNHRQRFECFKSVSVVFKKF